MSLLRVYHGSSVNVTNPDITHGRADADFGLGFYVTTSYEMAEKWACRKGTPIITEYTLDTNDLDIKQFNLDKEWLDFVVQNRQEYGMDFPYEEKDILVGATADDKMFATIEQYESGLISDDVAIKALNCMEVGTQLCIRTDKALEKLKYKQAIIIPNARIKEVRNINRENRKKAGEITANIIRKAIQEQNRKNQKEEQYEYQESIIEKTTHREIERDDYDYELF